MALGKSTAECAPASLATETSTEGLPVRRFVFADLSVFQFFHRRLKEIEGRWLPGTAEQPLEVLTAAMACIRIERDVLRRDVRAMASTMPGPYLIPV